MQVHLLPSPLPVSVCCWLAVPCQALQHTFSGTHSNTGLVYYLNTPCFLISTGTASSSNRVMIILSAAYTDRAGDGAVNNNHLGVIHLLHYFLNQFTSSLPLILCSLSTVSQFQHSSRSTPTHPFISFIPLLAACLCGFSPSVMNSHSPPFPKISPSSITFLHFLIQ